MILQPSCVFTSCLVLGIIINASCLNLDHSLKRRDFAGFVGLSGGLIGIEHVHAASPTSTAEAIRRGAAVIPGYGQTDVFYPPTFFGKWRVRRDLVSPYELSLEYDIRFIQSVDDRAVVADRGFNQAAFEDAVRRDKSVRSYQWTETNPNDLRIVLEDGSKKEIKVTKRATEMTETTVSSSEFRRVTTEADRGIPNISAERVLTKWKVVDDFLVEGLEIVYDMGAFLGDPLAMQANAQQQAPKVLSKSRLHLERIPQT